MAMAPSLASSRKPDEINEDIRLSMEAGLKLLISTVDEIDVWCQYQCLGFLPWKKKRRKLQVLLYSLHRQNDIATSCVIAYLESKMTSI